MSAAKHIAAGFVQDADKLLIEFVKTNSKEFSAFTHYWKKHNFSAVYLGRSATELQQFTHEIFQLTLKFMLSENLLHQIGAVYLLYALFRNQVVEPPTRIRVTFSQYDQFIELRKLSVEERVPTLHYIIGYLMEHGFDFVAHPSLVGPRNAKHSLELDKKELQLDCMMKDLNQFSASVCDEGLLQEIKQLNEQYTELTKHELFKDVLKDSHDFELETDFLNLSKLGCLGGNSSEANQEEEEEENIGSRRSQIKANAFASKAWFKNLHPAEEEDEDNVRQTRSRTLNQYKKGRILTDDEEDEESDEKEASSRRGRRGRLPRNRRRLGRPRKRQGPKVAEADENSELKCVRKRGPVCRSSYLDGYVDIPLDKPSEEIATLSSTSDEFEEHIDEPEKEVSNEPEKENSDEIENEEISDELEKDENSEELGKDENSDESDEDLYKPEKEINEESEEDSDESDSEEESNSEPEEVITIEDLTF